MWFRFCSRRCLHRAATGLAKRISGSREGLTATQAERELQRRIDSERVVTRSGMTLGEVGERYVTYLETVLERKPSTIADYRSMLKAHLKEYFGNRPIEKIDAERIAGFLAAKKRSGLATKTISNQLVFLHGLFAFAVKRGWIVANPVPGCRSPSRPDRRSRHPLPRARKCRGAAARRAQRPLRLY